LVVPNDWPIGQAVHVRITPVTEIGASRAVSHDLPDVGGDPSQRYLQGRLLLLERRVKALVEHRRHGDPEPDAPFRGLYVSEEQVDHLLTTSLAPVIPPADSADVELARSIERAANEAEDVGHIVGLRAFSRAFGLTPLDEDCLVIALAPDLDPRFEKLYGYLNDDVTRRRASVGLALQLAGANLLDGAARARLGDAGPLVMGMVVTVEDPDRPFLTRSVRVHDRVVSHLLGESEPDLSVKSMMIRPFGDGPVAPGAIGTAIAADVHTIYLRERAGAAGLHAVAGALRSVKRVALCVDFDLADPHADQFRLIAELGREARMMQAVLVVTHVDALVTSGPAALRALCDLECPLVLIGSVGWDPRWSREPPLLLDAPLQSLDDRRDVWTRALATHGADPIDDTPLAYRLTPEQIRSAAAAAAMQALADERAITQADLQAGSRAQNAAGLEHLARRVPPVAKWDDLVLPSDVEGQLRSIVARVNQRERVLDEWGMGDASSRGRGITVLFSGDSGTGKTMSAEVVANELGLDLYVIDLSTVVDKYIGETEKNLDRIFAEADRVNGVLLFDEADAIFGKRSEVRDAKDRYANVEVAYLLQRMEQFEGIAVLTTNLRANVDEAFLRRIDVLVEFPMPDEASRRELWRKQLRPGVPTAGDIDISFLSSAFELAGGNIRNIALSAAYRAADEGAAVGMAQLVTSAGDEYRKLGRLCVEAEFGPYFSLVSQEGNRR
jgi:hypothetical protein